MLQFGPYGQPLSPELRRIQIDNLETEVAGMPDGPARDLKTRLIAELQRLAAPVSEYEETNPPLFRLKDGL